MVAQESTSDIPKIISVDDHVVEPLDLWTSRLPARYAGLGPHVERQKGHVVYRGSTAGFDLDDGPTARWADVWYYEDTLWPMHAPFAAVGPVADLPGTAGITYDEMVPGCVDQKQRLSDMDLNDVEASLCFPTVPRFCGQLFLNRKDPELAELCVRAYNDWMIDDWGGGDGYGRLLPLTLIPLWDPVLAAAEVRRCAEKGSHAVCFSEEPSQLGLPSIYSDAWEPFFAACDETKTVINMHIGSSSKMPTGSPGAPMIAGVVLTAENSAHALVDWLLCGALDRYPNLKIALSESQVGWMPFVLERLDSAWRRADSYDASIYQKVPEPPSHYMADRVYACVFDDVVGLQNRDRVGMGQIMFETDYPLTDGTYPNSKRVAEKMIAEAGLSADEGRQFVRGNAISCYGLQRYGIS